MPKVKTSRAAGTIGIRDVTAHRCSGPLRFMVGGPSEVCAKFCGMGPQRDEIGRAHV